jgi:hypothetical protein
MAAAGKRNHGKERFWRRVVGQWRRSGQTVRAFCGEQGLSEPSFYAWRRIIAERDQQSRCGRRRDGNGQDNKQPVFVPVRVAAASSGPLEVVLGQGRVVRVGSGFDAVTLRQLLAVLEGPPC